jgi:tetratricopeptide (TPR) repeat protein
VQRYLDGEPILARRPSAAYQLRKLVGRHKVPFAFATALVLIVVAFGVVSTIQATRERAARAKADHEAVRAKRAAYVAERTQGFLEELLLAADPRWTSHEMTVRELLAEAERRVDADYAGDVELEADLRTLLGRIYVRFGIGAKALAQFEAALRIRERRFGDGDLQVAEARANVASLMWARGRPAEGVELYERALATQRELLPAGHPDLLATLTALGQLRRQMGDLPEAERLFREVLAFQRRTCGGVTAAVAETLDDLAAVAVARGQFPQAEELYREGLTIRQRLFGEEHKLVACSYHRIASAYQDAGDYARAHEHYQRALGIYERLPNEKPNVLLMLLYLGQLKEVQEDYAAALDLFEDALLQAEEAFPAWHYITLWCHKEYGDCLAQAGRKEEAVEHLLTCLVGYRKLSGDDHVAARGLRESLADLYEDLGKPVLAAEYRRQAAGDVASGEGPNSQ